MTILAASILPIRAQQSTTLEGSAQDTTLTGKNLIDACRLIANGTTPPADKSFQAGICLGELEALNWGAPGAYDENLRSCVPDGVTRQQLANVAVDYLDGNRDRLREPFEGLALESFAHSWPCPKTQGMFGKRLD